MDNAVLLEPVLNYHQETKHHVNKYARSLGYMDWATQPYPFRRYDGARLIPLDHGLPADAPSFDALHETGKISPAPLNRATLSRFFMFSLALSAWKQLPGSEPWPLRINPSSGNLHPTEGYLIAGPVEEVSDEPGVFHYAPYEHALEQRVTLMEEEWGGVAGQVPDGCILLALTSIYWRESWKYGERAFRYCHHDVGHAIAAAAYSARLLGWKAQLIETVSRNDLAVLLGVHSQKGMEAEHPDGLLAVYPCGDPDQEGLVSLHLPGLLIDRLSKAEFTGKENRLSKSHHAWPIIEEVGEATQYPGMEAAGRVDKTPGRSSTPPSVLPDRKIPAASIFTKRRSAIAMDGETSISRDTFYHMMLRASPAHCPLPHRTLPWPPQVSLGIFVHRVEGLEPGLYLLARDPEHEPSLKDALHKAFLWKKPEACPGDLRLYLMNPADCQEHAEMISCHQQIASGGVFSLGMLARFEPALKERGPWFYPRLFWETGLIGQVLYLEAEAAGIRGTGIGCFFDDVMHKLLGIKDRSWQSLYHFTLGGPLEDSRLKTIEPYAHLDRDGGGRR
jgi:SagB-type dehydrogenase family enzyme